MDDFPSALPGGGCSAKQLVEVHNLAGVHAVSPKPRGRSRFRIPFADLSATRPHRPDDAKIMFKIIIDGQQRT
jgi:hypothetical protein